MGIAKGQGMPSQRLIQVKENRIAVFHGLLEPTETCYCLYGMVFLCLVIVHNGLFFSAEPM